MYLASTYYRGAMNVGKMRLFKTESEAFAYLRQTLTEEYNDNIELVERFFDQFTRIYKLAKDEEPQLIRRKG
jgi:hypothetical protein